MTDPFVEVGFSRRGRPQALPAPGQTLQLTALVHEAYLRLVDANKAQHLNSRGHFFAAPAETMRRILVERARSKRRVERSGGALSASGRRAPH
jgi:hypothetical protein